MGYLLDQEGKWVLKKAKATSKEAEEDGDEDASEDDNPVQWRKYVDGRLAEIITNQAELTTQVVGIVTQLQSLQTFLHEQLARPEAPPPS